MKVDINEAPVTALAEYARIPIAFTVERVLDVSARADGRDGYVLSERTIDTPYIKDYDAIPGNGPLSWPERFDLSRWGIFTASMAGRHVGGAVVAFDTPGLTMLDGRCDVAVLWDIRVSPDVRGCGIGSALFERALEWARRRPCVELRIETQNVNAGACRFYARHGCELQAVRHNTYPEFPNEIQLLWSRRLSGDRV